MVVGIIIVHIIQKLDVAIKFQAVINYWYLAIRLIIINIIKNISFL